MMANKVGTLSYALVTMASFCLVSGLLILKGGEPEYGETREIYINDRQYTKH